MAPGGVDRHRRRDLVHREVRHEEAHVGQRVDGHADLAHLALGPGVVRVVAHLGGQVEGARQPGLPGVEEELEALVGRLGGAEAGVLAHRPQLRAVHLGVDAPGVGEGARLPELRAGSQPSRSPAVHGLDGDARVGQAFGAALGVLLLRCHGHEPTEVRGGRGHRGRLRAWTTPGTRLLALRHLCQRPGAVAALLLRRPRLRAGRVTCHRVRVRPADGLARRGGDLPVHPARARRRSSSWPSGSRRPSVPASAGRSPARPDPPLVPGPRRPGTAARITELGGAVVESSRTTIDFGGTPLEFLYCTDPDGVRIELMDLGG